MRRRTTGGLVAIAAAAAGATIAVTGGGEGPPAAAARSTATATAVVERRTLVDRDTIVGTLGYASATSLGAGRAGVLTRRPRAGSVVERGGSLYELDGERTGWVFYGGRPAWRDLTPGMADGHDVLQLERNLEALGYHPGTVDGDWTSATTTAVKAFQADRDLEADGTLERGELHFADGPVRVGQVKAPQGAQVQPGLEIATLTSTRRQVEVDLPVDRQGIAREGARVVVTLPDGSTARGRVTSVGAVAEQAEGGEPTIPVTVRLRGRAARGSGYDQAPVDVAFEVERARRALTVPVTALLAVAGGGYVVEVAASGRRRRVPVEVGLQADDLVAVSSDELRAGMAVVVPE